MPTISNIKEGVDEFINNLNNDNFTSNPSSEGAETARDDFFNTTFMSDSEGITLLDAESSNAGFIEYSDLDVIDDEGGNIIVGNDGDNIITAGAGAGAGDDIVPTGDGDDKVSLGDDEDLVLIDGSDTQSIDGGDGNDVFVIDSADSDGEQVTSTLTSLNIGDRAMLADTNSDGVLSFDDVTISESDNGSVTFELDDGTTFTLDDVSVAQALNLDALVYDVISNDDGTYGVIIKSTDEDDS